jgi:hypothetical protein
MTVIFESNRELGLRAKRDAVAGTAPGNRCNTRGVPRPARFLAILLLALVIASCHQKDPTPPPDPAPPAEVPDPPKPAADEGWVVLHNDTGVTLVEFNVVPSPEGGFGWGENQFAEDTVKDGKTFTLKAVPCPDDYDLRAVGAGGEEAVHKQAPISCGAQFDWELSNFSG